MNGQWKIREELIDRFIAITLIDHIWSMTAVKSIDWLWQQLNQSIVFVISSSLIITIISSYQW